MAKLHIHPVGLVLLLLGLACWVIALGGLAATTKFCNDNHASETIATCAQTYQQDWWAVWFEFFLLLLMLFTCFLNIFPKARYVYLSYLTMVTALLSFTTQRMYTKSFNTGWLAKDMTSRAFDAAGVGAMFLCMVNFGLMVFIGLGAAKAEPEAATFTSLSTQGPPTGMGTGVMPGGAGNMSIDGTGMMKAGVPPAAPASF